MHQGSKETFEFVGDFITPDFAFSKKDLWDRMGMLGVFGDYAMNAANGDVLEIGCGESSIYLSAVAKKYGRRSFHCDIAPDKIINPLTVPGYFARDLEKSIFINAHLPEHGAQSAAGMLSVYFAGESDKFFTELDHEMQSLALSFIDGDHIYGQAKRDFENCLKRTVDNGFIILHDTYPPSEDYTAENKCGDVYRLRQEIEHDERVDSITLTRATAMGVGLTICRKRPLTLPYWQQSEPPLVEG